MEPLFRIGVSGRSPHHVETLGWVHCHRHVWMNSSRHERAFSLGAQSSEATSKVSIEAARSTITTSWKPEVPTTQPQSCSEVSRRSGSRKIASPVSLGRTAAAIVASTLGPSSSSAIHDATQFRSSALAASEVTDSKTPGVMASNR